MHEKSCNPLDAAVSLVGTFLSESGRYLPVTVHALPSPFYFSITVPEYLLQISNITKSNRNGGSTFSLRGDKFRTADTFIDAIIWQLAKQ